MKSRTPILIDEVPPLLSAELAADLDATPSLPDAVGAYLAALDEKRQFEQDYPNDSTKRWDEKLYAVENAESALRTAYAQVIPS